MKKFFACVISALCLFAANAVMAESLSKSGSFTGSQEKVTLLTGAVGSNFTDVSKGGSSSMSQGISHSTSRVGKGMSTRVSESVNVIPAKAVPNTDGIVVGAATVVRCLTVENGPKSESVCESRLMTNEDADALIKAAQILNQTSAYRTLSYGSASVSAASIAGASLAQSNQVTK